MHAYQQQFIELALQANVLKFGEFTLKSGRVSPYFFNAGLFNDGASLATLGQCYASAICENDIDFDVLFGPAYKGIPLVATAAVALQDKHNKNVSWAFNRKEAKDHGEGGMIVGAQMQGKVLIVDDVITAGTAIREIIDLLHNYPSAQASSVLVALDRQERGQGELSAIQEIEANYEMSVHSIITMADLMSYVEAHDSLHVHLPAMRQYREQYGI